MSKRNGAGLFWPNLITTPLSERAAEVFACIAEFGDAMVCVNHHSDVVCGASKSDQMADYVRMNPKTLVGVYDGRATISDVMMDLAAVAGEHAKYGRNRVVER